MMNSPKLELADIFRSCDFEELERKGPPLSSAQRRVLRDLMQCRTAALGGHLERCDQCGHTRIAYNSCRNRHCPKCQAVARAEWLEERAAELLPVEYFHVVFTLPEQLSPLALQNKRIIYGLLFKAASETLLEIAADPRHLGAEIGFLALLHTWGQTLQHHPHLHCVVPGGGLSPDHSKWIACRQGFFLPVRVLGRLFRRKFLSQLRKAFEEQELVCAGRLSHLEQKDRVAKLLAELGRMEWIVYAKPPFGGPERVLKYLARYTHRVAISNHRLLELSAGQVSFSYKDYAAGNMTKTMTLEVCEFTRRFLLHVLPRGFVRIRSYGFLANRCRQEKLELCRRLIEQGGGGSTIASPGTEQTSRQQAAMPESFLCPVCRRGRMINVETIRASADNTTGEALLASLIDSS
jgi:putative transposase/transposase-like zinc-binding protein